MLWNWVKQTFGAVVFVKSKHCASCQMALKSRISVWLIILCILSFNARSPFPELLELSQVIIKHPYSNTSFILCQESWLNKDTDNPLISLVGFYYHWMDRLDAIKKTGEGTVTYVNSSWCKSPVIAFPYSDYFTDSLTISCRPRTYFTTVVFL